MSPVQRAIQLEIDCPERTTVLDLLEMDGKARDQDRVIPLGVALTGYDRCWDACCHLFMRARIWPRVK
jgi:hypothetical protein